MESYIMDKEMTCAKFSNVRDTRMENLTVNQRWFVQCSTQQLKFQYSYSFFDYRTPKVETLLVENILLKT